MGICIAAVGTGLLTDLSISTTVGHWIGYQILYGFGWGGCIQAPNMAAQTVLPRDEVSIGASLMLFGQTLFGAIFVSVGQNVLDGQLADRLTRFTNITTQQIQSAGSTGILEIIPPQYHNAVLSAYNESLHTCFQVGLVMACLAIIGAFGMEWRNVKKEKDSATGEDPQKNQGIEQNKSQAELTHLSGKEMEEPNNTKEAILESNV